MSDTQTMGHTEQGGGMILSKLTLKGMGCTPELCKVTDPTANPPRVPGPLAVARIGGMATNIHTRKGAIDQNNPDRPPPEYKSLEGEFVGVNLITGEIFSSGLLYLPNGIQEMVSSFLTDKKTGDMIEFLIELEAYPSSVPAGYSWRAKPIEKTTPRPSPVKKFMQFMHTGPAMLAAPKEPATIEGTANNVSDAEVQDVTPPKAKK